MASCFIFSATCSFFCEIKSSVFLPNKLPDFGREFIPKGSDLFSIETLGKGGSFKINSVVFSSKLFLFSTSMAVSFFETLLSAIAESEKSTIFFLIQPHYFVG
jgi:hypothetical protein